jgi:hypothetical protein
VHRAAGIVGVGDGHAEDGDQEDALVAARALQHVAVQLDDGIRRRDHELPQVVRIHGRHCQERGRDPPVLVRRRRAGRDPRRRHRMQHARRPFRELARGILREGAEPGIVDQDLAAGRAVRGRHGAVETFAQVDDDVA